VPVEFREMGDADQRLNNREPLSADEARALFRWVGPLHHFLPRIQMDLALQQIEAIDRFNEASGKLTKAAIFVGCAQVVAAIIALIISLVR